VLWLRKVLWLCRRYFSGKSQCFSRSSVFIILMQPFCSTRQTESITVLLVKIGRKQKNHNQKKGSLVWKFPRFSHRTQFSTLFKVLCANSLPRKTSSCNGQSMTLMYGTALIILHALVNMHRAHCVHCDYFLSGFSFAIQVKIVPIVVLKLVRMTRTSFRRPSLCDVPIINMEKPCRLSTMKESLNLVHSGGQKIKYLCWLTSRLGMTEHVR
jgi:hypothetical protein